MQYIPLINASTNLHLRQTLGVQNISHKVGVFNRQRVHGHAMSSLSASILPDVNINQSLRAASLYTSMLCNKKVVFIFGDTVTGKEELGA